MATSGKSNIDDRSKKSVKFEMSDESSFRENYDVVQLRNLLIALSLASNHGKRYHLLRIHNHEATIQDFQTWIRCRKGKVFFMLNLLYDILK